MEKYTIEEIREMVDEAQSGWMDIYKDAEKDLNFYDSKNQWESEVYANRIKTGRHAITINRLPAFVHQVSNDIRQNQPSIRTLPANEKATQETAEIIQDYIRNIEYISKAHVAYDTAVENAIKCSIGFTRLDHDYVDHDTFEQQILIKAVPNALSCIIDPGSIEMDGSDARYGFILDTMPIKEFKKQYPDASPETFDARWVQVNAASFYHSEDFITIAEFFALHPYDCTIYQLSNGEVVNDEDYENLPIKLPIVNTRVVTKNQCYRYKCSGAEILEFGEFPSSYIPIVPTYGEVHWIGAKREIYSLIRNAKEPQRLYNYRKSLETELMQKAPKAPYLAAEGQLDGYEESWRDPDNSNVLIYKTTDVKGNQVGPPMRVEPILVQAGLAQAAMGDIEDMKATMGIYNADIGNSEQVRSGRAIFQEQKVGDVANFHFSDNLNRSIAHIGKIVLDMMQRVVDTPRILRVMGEDMEPRNVAITINGKPIPDQFAQIQGIEGIYDIGVGKYDVVVQSGPSYATKRQEAAESLAQLMQGNPQISQLASDIMVRNLDFPGSKELSDRLRKAVPPQFLDNENGEPQDLRPQLMQAEQMMHAAADHIQQLTVQIQKLEQEKQSGEIKAQIEAAKLQIEQQRVDLEKYKLLIEQEKAQSEKDKAAADIIIQHEQVQAEVIKSNNDAHMNTVNALASSGQLINPVIEQVHKHIGDMMGAIAGTVHNLGNSVNGLHVAHAEMKETMAKPKKVRSKRLPDGTLEAELVND